MISTSSTQSGELSVLIDDAINSTQVININLTNKNNDVYFDRFLTREVDVSDYIKIGKFSPALEAAQFGHLFSERLNCPGGYGNAAKRTAANYNTAHLNFGMNTEANIFASMTGEYPNTLSYTTSTPNFEVTPDGFSRLLSYSETWNYGKSVFKIVRSWTYHKDANGLIINDIETGRPEKMEGGTIYSISR